MHKVLILTAAIAAFVNARTSDGACTPVPLQTNFDITKYTGVWFSQAVDKEAKFENRYCEQARYSQNSDGTIRVYNSQYENATKTFTTIDAVGDFIGPHGKIKFFPFAPPGDYQVLGTDYQNYAVVYGCKDLNPGKQEYASILTRAQKPDLQIVKQALAIMKEKIPEYTIDSLARTYQGSNCVYIKDPIPSPQ